MVKELKIRKKEFENQTVNTIYFGGGTPSLLSLEEIQLLVDTIQDNYIISKTPEITLEANPDDLSEEKIIMLSKSLINRLSIGIQSFFEEDLASMNRAHTQKEARECVPIAVRYFKNITIDLIYGIPTMTSKRWKENLQMAFDFDICHISSYALTIEPKTALDHFIKQGKYPNVDEEITKNHFDILIEETKKNGFIQYEISNFGKPNHFSRHNTSYWLGEEYMGVGPSAHSYNKTHRSWNLASNAKYIQEIRLGNLPSTREKLSVENQFNEYIMTGLRTVWGVSLPKVLREFGEKYHKRLVSDSQKFIAQDLLTIQDKALKVTQKGKFLADGLASELFIIK